MGPVPLSRQNRRRLRRTGNWGTARAVRPHCTKPGNPRPTGIQSGPEPDPDDTSWIEPPICPECGALVRIYPTSYNRWVSLATAELPAKDVPEPFRWRLTRLPHRSHLTTDVVAVQVRGIDPLPGEPVVPAHRMARVPGQVSHRSPEQGSPRPCPLPRPPGRRFGSRDHGMLSTIPDPDGIRI
ncbi:DUF6083 domain-containing protein [Streptomyces sp. NPDC005122]